MPNNIIKIVGTGQPVQPEVKTTHRIECALKQILAEELRLSLMRKFLVMVDQNVTEHFEPHVNIESIHLYISRPNKLIDVIKTLPQSFQIEPNIWRIGDISSTHFYVYINS